MHLGHKAVHADFFPAARHRDLYSNVEIPKPKSMADTEENYRGKPDWVRRQRNSWHGVDGMYNHRVNFDQFYRDYCRTLAALDEGVGRVTEELESQGMLNDTLILYRVTTVSSSASMASSISAPCTSARFAFR
jgi:N-acetylglucosamine-6-sulfatase